MQYKYLLRNVTLWHIFPWSHLSAIVVVLKVSRTLLFFFYILRYRYRAFLGYPSNQVIWYCILMSEEPNASNKPSIGKIHSNRSKTFQSIPVTFETEFICQHSFMQLKIKLVVNKGRTAPYKRISLFIILKGENLI